MVVHDGLRDREAEAGPLHLLLALLLQSPKWFERFAMELVGNAGSVIVDDDHIAMMGPEMPGALPPKP